MYSRFHWKKSYDPSLNVTQWTEETRKILVFLAISHTRRPLSVSLLTHSPILVRAEVQHDAPSWMCQRWLRYCRGAPLMKVYNVDPTALDSDVLTNYLVA